MVYIFAVTNFVLMCLALCALSPSSENCYLAYPPSSSQSSSTGDLLIFDAVNLQAINIIQAHKSPLSCVTFNYDGSMIATASDKVLLCCPFFLI